MKRLIAGIIALGFALIMGCSAPEYILIVDNQSSHDVEYTMVIGYSTETRILTARNKYIHPNAIPAALKDKERMENYAPKELVYLNYYDNIYTFYDIPLSEIKSYVVKVMNMTGEKVTLKAGEWMDDMIDITPGYTDDANHTGTIYTDKPNFTVETESGFPAVIDTKFNKENNTFMVVIKWSN